MRKARLALFAAQLPALCQLLPAQEPAAPLQITVETGRQTATFDPRKALGAGLDGHWEGDELRMLSPSNVPRMLEAGLGPISVRLRTELAVEAWHWNPNGRWSDPERRQGYWTSDARPRPHAPILVSFGYKLPRRGNTLDEANDDGYSMLDDGNPTTFWKSNPYLAEAFTGEKDSRHPQWVILDFGRPVPIDAVRIHWAEPYAKRFVVEYASGGRVYFGGHPPGVWRAFPSGRVSGGAGGDPLLHLSDRPVTAQYLRIWMTESSGTALDGAADPRDRLGYAIREIEAGALTPSGTFRDYVVHTAGKSQTVACVSSTDPWHRAVDRDRKVEQPGVDLIDRSGLTRGLPIMLAAPVLYDIPDNAAALASYALHSGFSIARYELGEEPDGQRIDPRDFGALYAQTARAIRSIVPRATLGGPSFVTGDASYFEISYRDWIRAFRGELARRGQAEDLRFLSFEWYPFDDVLEPETEQIPKNAMQLRDCLRRLRSEKLPIVVGEFNYSAYRGQHEVDLGGALLNAETAAELLCSGGCEAAYYYGYEPNKLDQTSGSWGNHLMLLKGKDDRQPIPVATFHALRLLTNDWLDPRGGRHEACSVQIHAARDAKPAESQIGAYAVKRPDGVVSLLLINKDPARPADLSIVPLRPGSRSSPGDGSLITYSSAQYLWRADGPNGHPTRNAPPFRSAVPLNRPVTIPPWSISVLHFNETFSCRY